MSELTLTNISKRFGKTVALNNVSLNIQSGEFICLLGASGCGKTTLLRIIAGLAKHDHGQISLSGERIDDVACHNRNIGMVFQSLALFQHMNVGDNVAYGLKMRGVDLDSRRRRAEDLLSMVELDGYALRQVSSLSGGQKQRVAIARALALEPHLFLMDEPFSALDAGLRDHLQVEIKLLQQRLGITTVFVTHDQREAMALADRIVILNQGVIEQAAAPSEIYQRPRSRFVAEFVGANNLLDVDVSDTEVTMGHHNLGSPQGVLDKQRGKRTLAIRPEQVQLSVAVDDSSLHGEIIMRRQIGALIEYEIEVGGGTTVKQTAFQSDTTAQGMGDRVRVSWSWDSIWVLPN